MEDKTVEAITMTAEMMCQISTWLEGNPQGGYSFYFLKENICSLHSTWVFPVFRRAIKELIDLEIIIEFGEPRQYSIIAAAKHKDLKIVEGASFNQESKVKFIEEKLESLSENIDEQYYKHKN